jgi:hypothetical protein
MSAAGTRRTDPAPPAMPWDAPMFVTVQIVDVSASSDAVPRDEERVP